MGLARSRGACPRASPAAASSSPRPRPIAASCSRAAAAVRGAEPGRGRDAAAGRGARRRSRCGSPRRRRSAVAPRASRRDRHRLATRWPCSTARALSKPGDHENAVAQLRAMRGRCVAFLTAVAVHARRDAAETRHARRADATSQFRDYSRRRRSSATCAPSSPTTAPAAPRSKGSASRSSSALDGDDPTALIGLPLIALVDAARRAGVRRAAASVSAGTLYLVPTPLGEARTGDAVPAPVRRARPRTRLLHRRRAEDARAPSSRRSGIRSRSRRSPSSGSPRTTTRQASTACSRRCAPARDVGAAVRGRRPGGRRSRAPRWCAARTRLASASCRSSALVDPARADGVGPEGQRFAFHGYLPVEEAALGAAAEGARSGLAPRAPDRRSSSRRPTATTGCCG